MKLSKEAREARNAYFRKWRKANAEKVKRYNSKYWEKKAQEMQNDAEAE